MTEIIKLQNNEWSIDFSKRLGKPGGFGEVFEGYSVNKEKVAIKRLKVGEQTSADREIRIASDLSREIHGNIIPVYDTGFDSRLSHYFIVMAKAAKSLQDEIEINGAINQKDTIEIIIQIVKGLLQAPQLIHRDLKPGNILLHDGVWKVADFGIAKYVEESTQINTLKECLSPQYAAPEQWKLETSTNATDIYSLGCIFYTLLTTKPPFQGSTEELKKAHLTDEPPLLSNISPKLNTLVSLMLSKQPLLRPKTMYVLKYLSELTTSSQEIEVEENLAKAVLGIVQTTLAEEAKQQKEKTIEEQRREIATEASKNLSKISDRLFSKICDLVPIAKETYNLQIEKFGYPNKSVVIGEASINIFLSKFEVVPKDAFNNSGWGVYSGAIILVNQGKNRRYYWSSNLWFTNMGVGDEYRWYEVAYMNSPFLPSSQYEPYAVANCSDADMAAGKAMTHIQFGSNVTPIDQEKESIFQSRWIDILTNAINGSLSRPSRLPIQIE